MDYKVKEVDISKLKLDKNQPRQSYDQDFIKELAESILSNGLLTPPEVDETDLIIDGHCRVLACKLAKIKKIEVRVITLGKDNLKRLTRQVLSDIQKKGLSTEERYKSIFRLYGMHFPNEAKIYLTATTAVGGHDLKISAFSRIIGKDDSWISRCFDWVKLNREEPELTKGISPNLVQETAGIPKETRKKVIKKLKQKNIRNDKDAKKRVVAEAKMSVEFEEHAKEFKTKKIKKLIEEYKQDLCNSFKETVYQIELFEKHDIVNKSSPQQLVQLMMYLTSWTKNDFAPFVKKINERLKEEGKKVPIVTFDIQK